MVYQDPNEGLENSKWEELHVVPRRDSTEGLGQLLRTKFSVIISRSMGKESGGTFPSRLVSGIPTYIYIYIYIEREREREGGRETMRIYRKWGSVFFVKIKLNFLCDALYICRS